jgi:hypothetical protein
MAIKDNWFLSIFQNVYPFGSVKPSGFAVPIKINDIETTVPQDWSHITVEQFMAIQAASADDNLGKLAAFLNIKKEDLFNCRQVDLSLKVYPLLKWYTKPYHHNKYPKSIVIAGKTYLRPITLGVTSLGQFDLLVKAIQSCTEKGNSIDTILPDIIAIVFCKDVTGVISEQSIEQTKQLVLKSPFPQAMDMAIFFYQRFNAYLNAKVG